MNTGSLKLRMLLAATAAIAIAVIIAGTAFFFTFRRHAENLARLNLLRCILDERRLRAIGMYFQDFRAHSVPFRRSRQDCGEQ